MERLGLGTDDERSEHMNTILHKLLVVTSTTTRIDYSLHNNYYECQIYFHHLPLNAGM